MDANEQDAQSLWDAELSRLPIAPLTTSRKERDLAVDPASAYAIQRINRDRRIRGGDRVVGHKIGLTAKAVQQQLGVDSPDFGSLWSSSAFGTGEEIERARYIAPRVEAEVALVMARDLTSDDPTLADLIRAVDFALPALEIVDSRIADWKIGLFDTIADNASAAAFVLGADPRPLSALSLASAAMEMSRNGDRASQGSGAACMGHPLNAGVWLARTLARMGDPLRAGDIVLTGALGPVVPANAGDRFSASIDGLGTVAISFV